MFSKTALMFFVIIISFTFVRSVEAGSGSTIIAKVDPSRTPASAAAEVESGKVGWLVVAKSANYARLSQGRATRNFQGPREVSEYLRSCIMSEISGQWKRTYLDTDGEVRVSSHLYETRVAFVDPDGVVALMPSCLNGIIAMRREEPAVVGQSGAVYASVPPAYYPQQGFVPSPPAYYQSSGGGGYDWGQGFMGLAAAVLGRPVYKNNGNTTIYAPATTDQRFAGANLAPNGSFNGAGYLGGVGNNSGNGNGSGNPTTLTRYGDVATRYGDVTAVDARQSYNWQQWVDAHQSYRIRTDNFNFPPPAPQPIPRGTPGYGENGRVGVPNQFVGGVSGGNGGYGSSASYAAPAAYTGFRLNNGGYGLPAGGGSGGGGLMRNMFVH